jgi:hypothetical protein
MLYKPLPNSLGANSDAGMGAAYGTAKSGIGISGVGNYRPDLIMKAGPYCKAWEYC